MLERTAKLRMDLKKLLDIEQDRRRRDARNTFIVLMIAAIVAFFLIVALGKYSKAETAARPEVVKTVKASATKEHPDDKLIKGVLALRGNMRHVRRKAPALVASARKVAKESKKPWITPELLLALSMNESDLRWWLAVGLDCGIAQNRVNLWCRSRKCMKRLCKQLTKSAEKSMRYAVDELTRIDRRCGKRYRRTSWRWKRCLLNSYNQGPLYYREERCRRGGPKCWFRSRYWVRHECFERGIKSGLAPTKTRRGKKVRMRCRRATSLRWIRRAYPSAS